MTFEIPTHLGRTLNIHPDLNQIYLMQTTFSLPHIFRL